MKSRMRTLTDTEILDRMLARDEDAWVEFHRRFDRLIWSSIHKVAVRFGAVFSPEDAREVYAVFFASLWSNDMHKLRTFDPARGNKLGTWLSMLVTHGTYDHLRSFARHPTWEPLSAAEDIPDADDPFQGLCRREERDRLSALVDTFAPADQAFVESVFIHGDAPEAAAETLGLTLRAVYTKKHRIRARFERLLTDLRVGAAA